MSARATFIAIMAVRKSHRRGSADHEYLTRAARKLVWIIRDIPTTEWTE